MTGTAERDRFVLLFLDGRVVPAMTGTAGTDRFVLLFLDGFVVPAMLERASQTTECRDGRGERRQTMTVGD